MEKRVLLAVTLSFVVLFLYQSLVVRRQPQVPVRQTQRQPAPATAPPATAPSPGAPASAQPEAASVAPPAAAATPVVSAAAARDIVVETPDVRAVFTTRGAVLKEWRLKRFLDAAGRPLDLIPADMPPDAPRSFSLSVEDAAVTQVLREALYKPNVDRIDAGSGPVDLTFEYRDASGLSVRKTFGFDARTSPYIVSFTGAVERNGQPLDLTVHSGPAIGGAPASASSYYQQPQAIFYRAGDMNRLGGSDLTEQPVHEGRFVFVGVDDNYFLSAAVPPDAAARVEYRPVSVVRPGATAASEFVTYSARFEQPPTKVPFFFGPKEFDALAVVHRDMVRAINFGIFSWLCVPLLRSLKWIYGYVGNYGWAIVILTVLINGIMFPLRHKSVVSMRKMQELQPEVKAIQDRYAKLKTTDPARQKMNVELMNLYRERGVNPASGCIPMLLTMPVLFAFYSLLSQAVEIRGAPFILWIQDLSAHDPWYVTPLLMGGTMVWQQWITPMAGDPMQQKMMMFMPVVFTAMFLWVPSGLVLYWTVSNVWGIGQQYLTNWIIGPPRQIRPAAERRMKQAGSGKTKGAE
jgi:YidC/Oxa1 family membrane protein insertase